MQLFRSKRYAANVFAIAAVVLAGHASVAQAQIELPAPPKFDGKSFQDVVDKGIAHERKQNWLKAIQHYEDALKEWPKKPQIKYGLRRAKFHFKIDRRYNDESFDTDLLTLTEGEAFGLLETVYSKVQREFVDRLTVTSFVAHGTESLYLALANKKFLSTNLPRADRDKVQAFRKYLHANYWNKPMADLRGAKWEISRIAKRAKTKLGLAIEPVIMEFVFGGCNALDNYSTFLTPDRLDDLYGNIKGEFVGLGIEMKANDDEGLHLMNVLPDSPAAAGGLKAGDYIIGINGKDCRKMTTDEAARLLRGPKNSRVKITFYRPPTSKEDSVAAGKTFENTFTRRPVLVKSFPVVKMIDRENGVGYIKMVGFQKSSAKELDAALATLKSQGMRALVWDVRGNPGGLLTAAVEVLDRFIASGRLVSTKGRSSDQNWTYSAHRAGTHSLPLVLLVDENSASASEIVAGAIHSHRRGTIVGRKTYGKWSVQSIFPIRYSAGLRLTTAKFYAPNGKTYGKIGINPHVEVKTKTHAVGFRGSKVDLAGDADVKKGVEILTRQLAGRD